jgi:hypothetical protein
MKNFPGFTVKGKPFFALGAQSHNSSSSSREMFREACKAALALNCNTVEAPIYWEAIEKAEGDFDFSSLDYMVELCRARDLHLVVLWFATWKNGDLSYTPPWVKQDPARFKRALRSNGLATTALSAHYRENMEADAKAFREVMAYIKKIDAEEQTIIAVQVENEPGYLHTDRDFSPQALEDQKAPVPERLLSFLEKTPQAPAYTDWKKRGMKRGCSWEETFGFHGYEYCAAWFTARYVDQVSAAGKEKYPLPTYINVWLNDGNPWGIPGVEYPGGGAVPKTFHVWTAALESIDIIAPDIYEGNVYRVEKLCDLYSSCGNALFVPESGAAAPSAYNMFYAVAKGAVGYASFASESALDKEGNLTEQAKPMADSNLALLSAMPLLLKHRNTGRMQAVLKHDGQGSQGMEFEDFLGSVTFGGGEFVHSDYTNGRDPYTGANAVPRGLVFEDDSRTFYLTGLFNLRLVAKKSPDVMAVKDYLPLPVFLAVEEGHFEADGSFKVDKIRNGDEVFFGGFWVTPRCGVVRVKLA